MGIRQGVFTAHLSEEFIVGVAYTPDSPFAIEARKWESQHTAYGPPGRPYEYREYPKRVYKANDAQGRSFESVEVASEQEERNFQSRGFRGGQAAALEAFHARETEIAIAAAERAFADRRMSEKAQAEAKAADEATPHHLPSIPETPIKRRGRKPKGASDAI